MYIFIKNTRYYFSLTFEIKWYRRREKIENIMFKIIKDVKEEMLENIKITLLLVIN